MKNRWHVITARREREQTSGDSSGNKLTEAPRSSLALFVSWDSLCYFSPEGSAEETAAATKSYAGELAGHHPKNSFMRAEIDGGGKKNTTAFIDFLGVGGV